MKKYDSRNSYPWILIDYKNYRIIEEGHFCDLVGKSGNLMTKDYYAQFLDEIK